MKKFYLLALSAAVGLMSVTGCKEDPVEPTPEQPDPVFQLSENAIQVAVEGGLYEIAYVLANPVEGAELELVSDVDWVSDPDYSQDGKIVVNVAPNYGNEDRNANLNVTYTYGEGLVLEDQVILHQVYAYDVNSELKYFNGGYFYGRESTQANYAMYLTDLELNEYGSFSAGSNVYRLDVHSDVEPTDWAVISLPEGTYTFEDLDNLTSYYGKVNAAGDAWETTAYITDCYFTVTRDGDNTVVEGTVTVGEDVHRIHYEGSAIVGLYSADGLALIQKDLEFTDTHIATGPRYVDDNGEVMVISFGIADEPEDGDYLNPFTLLYVEMYAPFDSRKILSGTYTIGNSQDAYTLYPGYIDSSTLYCFGTYALSIQGGSSIIALAEEGTITVTEGNDGIYTLDVNLKTVHGFSITGTYVGELDVPNIPGESFSTLTDDYTVRMDEITSGFGFYWGDEFGTGGGHFEWSMSGPFEQNPDTYLTDGTGESVSFDIVCNSMDYQAGISSGTYTVAEDPEAPKPGEFVPGSRSEMGMNVLSGTYYVGGYENGYVSIAAPAVGGELEVTNHGDGTYTLKFAFKDGMGHIWDGEWTGPMSFLDWTWLLSSSADAERPNYVERRMAPAAETEDPVNPAAQYMIKTLPSL